MLNSKDKEVRRLTRAAQAYLGSTPNRSHYEKNVGHKSVMKELTDRVLNTVHWQWTPTPVLPDYASLVKLTTSVVNSTSKKR